MPLFKKIMAATLLGGGLVAGAGYLMMPEKGVQNRKMTAELRPIRHDTLADHLHRQITTVARLTARPPRPVIFDNDADIDDAMALILIGNDQSISLQAITVNGTGMAHGRPGAENMAAMARLLGKRAVPVAFGRDKPLTPAGTAFPEAMRQKRDQLLDPTSLNKDNDIQVGQNAVALMQDVVSHSAQKVTILATGPLTNVAEFLKKYPQSKANIEKIVVMGGAVNAPGNIQALTPASNNHASEWNFYADPAAVKTVFASGVPITLVALDATNQVPLTRDFFEALTKADQPDLKLAKELMTSVANDTSLYLWDALAAMVMLNPSVATLQSMPLIVNEKDGSLRVAAKQGDRHAATIDVVTRIQNPDFVLHHYVAMVKSNHIVATRQFHRAMAQSRQNENRIVNHAESL